MCLSELNVNQQAQFRRQDLFRTNQVEPNKPDYEAFVSRLFNQASYTFPVETLLRLRRGSGVLIKLPADGRE